MIQKFLNKITSFGKAAGIFVHILPDEQLSYHLIWIKAEKNELSVEPAVTTQNTDELLSNLETRYPVFLNIDGKGVLHKKNPYGADKKYAHQIFPNINTDHFNFQFFDENNNGSYISLIRKETLVKIREPFENKSLFLTNITLGPFSATYMKDMLNTKSNDLFFGLYQLTFEENVLTGIKPGKKDTCYDLGNMEIQGLYLPVFSMAVVQLADDTFLDGSDLNIDHFSYNYYKYFRTLATGLILFLFVALLFNYFSFEKWKNNKESLSLEAFQNEKAVEKIKKLNKDIELAERIIDNSGIKRETSFSMYADKIASFVPSKIILDEMWIQPVPENLKSEQEIVYQKNHIRIKGETSSDLQFNSWQRKLENENWVYDLIIVNYEREDGLKTASFEIDIEIK